MPQYDFSTQKELFNISYQILNDYNIEEWSFGGGTALSALYYQHRMSYDIDIFSEDFSAIQRLINYKEEIAKNLGIGMIEVASSTTGITFGLDDGGLKLDFVYSPVLCPNSYTIQDVFGHTNVKVQTPMEIIAKKLKHREKATIRDFVDYAMVEDRDKILTKLKSEGIVDIERYFDVIDKFNNFDNILFNEELENLLPKKQLTKDDFTKTINNLMRPKELTQVALDTTGEVVAFDEFIEPYRTLYEEIGTYSVYTIQSKGKSYQEILQLTSNDILGMHENQP